jgi:hypothetical protein
MFGDYGPQALMRYLGEKRAAAALVVDLGDFGDMEGARVDHIGMLHRRAR